MKNPTGIARTQRRAPSLAGDNARKIRALLESENGGSGDLYRTILAGPSGQRADLLVGRVRYLEWGPDDFEIVDPRNGSRAGLARREVGLGWSITAERYDGSLEWLGWASTLSVGVDALFNGVHAATGRHDSRRISPGWIRRGSAPCVTGAVSVDEG